MAETALKFGPEWLRALAHGNSASPPVSPDAPPLPKYKLAQYRYGREEMLALYSKDLKVPDEVKEFDFLVSEKNQLPLALQPVSEEEQRIWARSVNSDIALRISGKTVPSEGALRGGRGGSVDRGRGRGRGGYYQRGMSFEENEDGQPSAFARLRTMERSQSASEKDQCWEESRDRRFERPFGGRSGGGVLDSSTSLTKDVPRVPVESWRRAEKDDDGSWRTAGTRGVEKFGGRSSWRNHDRDRNRTEFDGKEKHQHNCDLALNGPGKSKAQNPRQRTMSGHIWDDDGTGDNLPEWSVEEPPVTDVGSFDSSGAFMETKVLDVSGKSDDLYISDDEEIVKKEIPEEKVAAKSKVEVKQTVNMVQPTSVTKIKTTETSEKPETFELLQSNNSMDTQCMKKPSDLPKETSVKQTVKDSMVPVRHGSAKTVTNKMRPEIVQEVAPLSSVLASSATVEEDAFAHHEKATEIMMAKWTEEEEHGVASELVDRSAVLPFNHDDAQKWFYRDPQGEIQGPFASAEMCEWFSAGYFAMNLLVRRGCDEKFLRLRELIEAWGRVPFQPGTKPPPLRVTPVSTPLTTPISQTNMPSQSPSTQAPAQMTRTDAQFQMMQQQMIHQFMQQQLLLRQAQMQQLLTQLKQQEAFTNLNSQQQNQVVQQLLAQQQQQVPRPGGLAEAPVMEPVPTVPFPLMGLTVPPMAKSDLSLWSIPPHHGPWAVGQSTNHLPSGSIWDTDTSAPIEASELEKKQLAEEEEKQRLALEAAKQQEEEKRRREEEQKRNEEELRRKEEEELRLKELQRQKEEEKKRLEEMHRLKEEEQRRQEEFRRMEERRKEDERRLEELRKLEEERLEELRKREEEKKLEELRKLEKQRKLEEQRKCEEQKRLEEQRKLAELEEQKKQELLRKEEQRKQEELLKAEEKKRQDELQARMREQERLEAEKQEEAQRLKEEELELRSQMEAEKAKELQLRREMENNRRTLEQKGPVWGAQNFEKPSNELSLTDIQKLQEKESEERERIEQLHQQQLLLQQQSLKQAQATKNGLSWAKRSNSSGAVKSLAEIQQEEAERMAQQQKVQKTAATTVSSRVQAAAAAGVWGNSSQINRVTSAAGWNNNASCFWDSAAKSATAQKSTKTNDSAFPALSNSNKPASANSNKSKNVRAKKDGDAVLKLFETHRKPTDEFTAWCTEALSNLPSSVDVPTFVAFLKDVESPYEVFDYVRSYLGEGKEAREFGKQFLERRSKYRNQAKQNSAEENMWGPAPAITPAVNKPTVVQSAIDCDATTCTKGKAKKKKNRMQKLDSSMLGFTVQPNPDRINVGEIDRVEGM